MMEDHSQRVIDEGVGAFGTPVQANNYSVSRI